MPPPSLQWFALRYLLGSRPHSHIWVIQSSAFHAFLSRLIPTDILNILLYPWTFHVNLVDSTYADNPFRHLDEDLIPLYYHSRATIRRAFLYHRCNQSNNTLYCPHLQVFLEFERAISQLCIPFPDLQFFNGDPVSFLPSFTERDIAIVSSYMQAFVTHQQPPPVPVAPSSSLIGVDFDELQVANLESLEDSDEENIN